MPFPRGLLSTSVSGLRLGLSTPLTPTILEFLFVKSSYEGPASPLSVFCGGERYSSRRPNSMSVLGLGMVVEKDPFKGILAGRRGLSDFDTYYSMSVSIRICSKEEKGAHLSHILER